MKHLQLIYLFLFGILSTGIVSCTSSDNKKAEKDQLVPIAVNVSNPLMNTDNTITATGQIVSAQSADISTRVMGYITSIKVKVGDYVKKGQLLVTISNDDMLAKRAQIDAMLSGANASLQSAEKDLQRFNNLYQQKSATAKELDNVTLQHRAAKAGVQSALQMRAEVNSMLAYTNITAPFSGIVSQKMADAGSMANPGMPILVLEQGENLLVKAQIPETEISRIKHLANATVVINAINKTIQGTVSEISPSSLGTGGQFVVKISLPQEIQKELSAGMYANVIISSEVKTTSSNAPIILIPIAAVQRIGQLDAIFTIGNNGRALLRYVRLGKNYGNNVEVLSGLGQNESYISFAEKKLYNGAPVKAK